MGRGVEVFSISCACACDVHSLLRLLWSGDIQAAGLSFFEGASTYTDGTGTGTESYQVLKCWKGRVEPFKSLPIATIRGDGIWDGR